MKLAITADIHYGTLADDGVLTSYLESLAKAGIDHLAVAGDLISRGAEHKSFGKMMSILGKFPIKLILTPGNHDLWTAGDSFNLLTKKLPHLLKNTGHHLLDGNPLILGDLALVGSVGWYDYSFRTVPDNLAEHFESYVFRFPASGDDFRFVRWSQLDRADYLRKTCVVSADEGVSWRQSTWQDSRYIKWDFDDEGFLDYCIERLASDIESVYDRVKRIVVLTHHLPFYQFVPDIPDPTWGFHRAFLGSSRLGEVLLKYPKVRHVFFGHNHRNRSEKIGHLWARNLFFHGEPGTFYIEIEE